MANDAVIVDGDVTWEVVHAELTQIAKRRATLDAEEAAWLRRAEALQIWKPLGMVNALDYMERTLGYAPHAAHERLRVARALGDLPIMETAFADGRLSFTAVRELSRVATPTTEAAWVATAVGKSLREIEPIVANHQPGDNPDDPPTPVVRNRKLSLELPPETYAVLRQAHHLLDDEHGRRLERHELIDVMARRTIAAAPVSEPTGRATFQLAVTVCGCCKKGWQEGGGELIPVGSAVVERAECDAQWISIAGAAQAQLKAGQDIPPSIVRFIYRRDHGRCRVPGCRSTRCLEIHHIIRRVDGGTHDVWNLVLVCSSCHQAHHDGRLLISGTADKLEVVRPAAATSHVGPASPLANAIARAQAKATLVRMRWKAGVARAAVDRVAAELPPDASAEAIFQAAMKLDASDVGPSTAPDATADARSALVSMGWSVAVARAAIDRAAPELPAGAAIDAIIRAALKHCPAPLHTQIKARDGAGPTWDEHGSALVSKRRSVAVAHAAIDRAAPELPAGAAIAGPTWDVGTGRSRATRCMRGEAGRDERGGVPPTDRARSSRTRRSRRPSRRCSTSDPAGAFRSS